MEQLRGDRAQEVRMDFESDRSTLMGAHGDVLGKCGNQEDTYSRD